MKNFCKKLSDALRVVFGYGIVTTLFAGGLTFFGYVVALVIGGEAAAVICTVLYKKIIPVIIYTSVIMVLLGLVIMYLTNEVALTPDKKHEKKHHNKV